MEESHANHRRRGDVRMTLRGAASFVLALGLFSAANGCRADVDEPPPARPQAAAASSAAPPALGATLQIQATSAEASPFSAKERARVCQKMCEHTRSLKCAAVANAKRLVTSW